MFNPFGDKSLSDLTVEDIAKLVADGVTEGHYVEYKSELPNAADLAKAVASFANAHGGWLFFGVESDPTTNAATQAPGLDTGEVGKLADRVRDAVVGNLSPVPAYFGKAIDVAADRLVYVVQVPEGDETPYIHRNGRIYRRHGAGGDPVPENNRYEVDDLYQRAQRSVERFRQFATLPWSMPRWQADQPLGWLELYTWPKYRPEVTLERFRELADPAEERKWWSAEEAWEVGPSEVRLPGTCCVPFDQASSWAAGYSVSQLAGSAGPRAVPLTVEVRYYGACRAFIPLHSWEGRLDEELEADLSGRWGEEARGGLVLFDGEDAFRALFTLAVKCARLAAKWGAVGPLRVRTRADNCWCHVPYFPTGAFREFVTGNGWPVCRRQRADFPDDVARQPYQEIDGASPGDFAMEVTTAALRSLGIPAGRAAGIMVGSIFGAGDRPPGEGLQ